MLIEDEKRKSATSMREYLQTAKEAVGIFQWIWKETVPKLGREKLFKMIGSLVFLIILQALQPGAVSYIFNGLSGQKLELVIFGLG